MLKERSSKTFSHKLKQLFVYTKSGALLKGFAKDSLIALNIFIVFLLVFENKYAVPQWLQPVGRMHPLLLHFPIVLLVIGMLLEFFRFNKSYVQQDFYQVFNRYILFAGVLLSGITAIMGLFLSKEEGYEENALMVHKWSGVTIFFIGSLICWFRNTQWYQPAVAKTGAVLMLLTVISAGHFGAAITHGDNFILGPLASGTVKENVVLEDARVFDHMVKPILDNKCVSCHNSEKIKGGLMLTDAESILKGGKSGDLFVAGNPEISLLLKRIHLPGGDKKHMPPKGKTQLTEEEIAVLQLWVKANADFKLKAIDLPATDSLRIMANAKFRPLKSVEENYTFSAADDDIIKKLNNEYRVISLLAKGSPALAVNFYNKSAYNSQSLSDLSPVKEQIVQLSLNKMPVKDADLKIISQFINLRKLDLNFSEITGQGLKILAPLIKLQHLSISGTNMTLTALKKNLASFKGLQQVALWNCGLSEADIRELKQSATQVIFLQGFTDDGSHPVKLNIPVVEKGTFVFADSTIFKLKHTIKGVQVRYTVDGSDPDSISSPIFDKDILVRNNISVKARAFKKGWISSDTATFRFFKNTYTPDSIFLLSDIYVYHNVRSIDILSDKEMATFERNEKWLGFSPDKLEMLYKFNAPKMLSSVSLHMLIDEDEGFYPPSLIEIWVGENKNNMKLVAKKTGVMPVKGSKVELKTITAGFSPVAGSCLKIVASTIKGLPAFNPEKGDPPVMMFDEIFIN